MLEVLGVSGFWDDLPRPRRAPPALPVGSGPPPRSPRSRSAELTAREERLAAREARLAAREEEVAAAEEQLDSAEARLGAREEWLFAAEADWHRKQAALLKAGVGNNDLIGLNFGTLGTFKTYF